MSRGGYYTHDTTSQVTCPDCGWAGTFADLKLSNESEEFLLVGFECPVCFENIVLAPFPTINQIRSAAKRGNTRAIHDLAAAEERDRQDAAREASLLGSADQLPALDLPGPTRFIWDAEIVEGDHWTVIRVAPDGRQIWREAAFWEGWERFPKMRDLLCKRYREGFGDLGLTRIAGTWVVGDDARALEKIGDPPLVTPDGKPDPIPS